MNEIELSACLICGKVENAQIHRCKVDDVIAKYLEMMRE